MKRRIAYLYLVLLLIFTGSCVPWKEISFESLQPANFSIPPGNDSILVLNNSYHPWVDTSSFNILAKIDPKEGIIADTMVMNSIFNGLFSVLDQSEFENLQKTIYHEIRNTSTNYFLEPLSLESINLLCENFNTEFIISLEYYGFDFDQKFVSGSYVMISEVATIRKMLWRIYQKELGMIDEYKETDTLFYEGYIGQNLNEASKNMTEVVKAMKYTFWYGGEKYGKYLSPSWREEERFYFPFTYKYEEISLDEEGLTRFLSESNNNVRKFKAWNNLAVYYEKSGDPESAIEAVDSALSIYPKATHALDYKKELSKVIKQKKILDKQLDERLNSEK